jgi:CheY-like chemotaxis protein/tRNA A-37 threonylcarbamoyl transferase component Bud32
MDATAANLDLSRDTLLANLAASRLLAEDEMRDFVSKHPSLGALALSEALISSGLLTAYQLESICQGFPEELRIGNYDVLDKLGAGGMGTVMKARHRRMKRVVAIKLLLPKFCENDAFVRRFQREVETIAKLGHPNIVMAYDADECDSGHFLVMEFVDGRDLASVVEKAGPMTVPEAVDCILQAARGLAYAHSLNVIHRDIKPANLLRDKNGVVKVTDLGLARLAASPEAAPATGITQAGFVLGTPDYMPPEQAVDSTDLDQRADIYSLGATLFVLLTGSVMYPGHSVMAVLLNHRDAEIPPLKGAPPALEAIFRKMVAKMPADRYQSMNEVIAALEALVPGKALTGPMPAGTVALSRSEIPTITQKTFVTVIVEPSRVQAGIIRKFVEAQDLTVAAAVGTGAEALAAVRQHRPDAVLCSYHLADTSGVDLAGLMHAEMGATAPGFVLVSSEDDGSKAGAMSRLARTVVLLKPFTPEQLVLSLSLVTGKTLAVKAADSSLAGVPSLKPVKRDRAALKVLIVDDSTVCRVYEKQVLEQLGFRTFSEASDGANAIAAATREPFDLIVTDYNMPLMDGFALVSYLKQTPATAQVPIVMVTTETDATVLDPVRALGVAAVFDKSFNPEDVKALMDRLFP